eukprot:13198586-Alexandrium_andersonii.AAC.1
MLVLRVGQGGSHFAPGAGLVQVGLRLGSPGPVYRVDLQEVAPEVCLRRAASAARVRSVPPGREPEAVGELGEIALEPQDHALEGEGLSRRGLPRCVALGLESGGVVAARGPNSSQQVLEAPGKRAPNGVQGAPAPAPAYAHLAAADRNEHVPGLREQVRRPYAQEGISLGKHSPVEVERHWGDCARGRRAHCRVLVVGSRPLLAGEGRSEELGQVFPRECFLVQKFMRQGDRQLLHVPRVR